MRKFGIAIGKIENLGVSRSVNFFILFFFRNCSVQDADKLDAIGAFGVLRCAAFSGARNISLFNPDDAPIEGMTKEQYEQQTNNGGGSAINHFHGEIRCFMMIWFLIPMI